MNAPVAVGRGDADAERKAEVEEEALAEHAGNGGDGGHCGRECGADDDDEVRREGSPRWTRAFQAVDGYLFRRPR